MTRYLREKGDLGAEVERVMERMRERISISKSDPLIPFCSFPRDVIW